MLGNSSSPRNSAPSPELVISILPCCHGWGEFILGVEMGFSKRFSKTNKENRLIHCSGLTLLHRGDGEKSKSSAKHFLQNNTWIYGQFCQIFPRSQRTALLMGA